MVDGGSGIKKDSASVRIRCETSFAMDILEAVLTILTDHSSMGMGTRILDDACRRIFRMNPSFSS